VVAKGGQELKSTVQMYRGQLLVNVFRRWSRDRKQVAVRKALHVWFRERAFEWFTIIADQYSQRLGIPYRCLRLFEMKSRWGSSGINGTLRLNWRIIMAPRRLVEYVVAHEICHLKHNHHSTTFWTLLAKVMPDYAQRREQLAGLGSTLDL